MNRSLSSINIKKKKSPKNRTDSHKKYKEFLMNKNKLKSVKNPINTLMKNSLKQTNKLRIPKVDRKVKFVDTIKPHISIDTKKVIIEKDPFQPIFKIDRDKISNMDETKIDKISNMDETKIDLKLKKTKKKRTKKKRRKARKARKVTFTIKSKDKTKKKERYKEKTKNEMMNELKNRGVTISGKSNSIVKNIYACVMNDNIQINKE